MATHTLRLKRYQAKIDRKLGMYLPPATARPVKLHQAMRYSVFAGGKRLRPLLCCLTAEACGGSWKDALLPAVALEYLHTYTLIHDDLPAMDDDDLRRGKPTNHRVFGEATAILAGDALLTLAFEVLSTAKPPAPYTISDLVKTLSHFAGSRGVVGGQAEDMAGEALKKIPPRQLRYIHEHKTANLIQAAVVLGGMMAGLPRGNLKHLMTFGLKLGLAFQITDDILNETGTREQLGKAVKSDTKRHKHTAVRQWGIKGAQQRAEQLYGEALVSLKTLGIAADSELGQVAHFVIHRSY